MFRKKQQPALPPVQEAPPEPKPGLLGMIFGAHPFVVIPILYVGIIALHHSQGRTLEIPGAELVQPVLESVEGVTDSLPELPKL